MKQIGREEIEHKLEIKKLVHSSCFISAKDFENYKWFKETGRQLSHFDIYLRRKLPYW